MKRFKIFRFDSISIFVSTIRLFSIRFNQWLQFKRMHWQSMKILCFLITHTLVRGQSVLITGFSHKQDILRNCVLKNSLKFLNYTFKSDKKYNVFYKINYMSTLSHKLPQEIEINPYFFIIYFIHKELIVSTINNKYN